MPDPITLQKMPEPWRWFLTLCVAGGAFWAGLYFNIFLIFTPIPRSLGEAIGGFVAGSLTVLAGVFLAPRERVPTALALCVVAVVAASVLFGGAIWVLAGGLTATGFAAWLFGPRRRKRVVAGFAAAIAVILATVSGFCYAKHVDWPARPAELPVQLQNALGSNTKGVTAFYQYDRGGFIDHQWLWRIDADAATVALIVKGLELQPVKDAPAEFLTMPPHYWPRAIPLDAQAFQSHDFPAADRGPDGSHYFLLHDKTRGQAFVWFKDNF